MLTALFAIICLIYIGLGIPDSSLGASWPAIFKDLGLYVGSQGIIAALISLGTVTASFFSSALINKFGTAVITAFSTLLSALSLLAFSLSGSLWWFCLFAIPLGLAAGAIDAALNNYVAIHFKPSHMNFLHCFYGLGVAISPFIISLTLNLENGWRLGYQNLFYIQLALAILAFVTIPLWKKADKQTPDEEKFKPVTLTFKQMIKMPAVRSVCFALFFATALEFTCNNWACTFLVESQGLSKDVSAKFGSLFFVGLTLGRFLSGLVANKVSRKNVLFVSYAFVGIGLALLFLPIPAQIKGYSLLIIGLGNGPVFPNVISATPEFFGKENSQSIVGIQMVACNAGIMILPPLFGVIAQLVSPSLFPYFTVGLLALTIIFTLSYSLRVKKLGKTL